MVETITTTEAQRSISPIQPNFSTPKLKNPTLKQAIVQSRVKPSVARKCSQRDYQTFRPVTKPSNKQKTSHRKSFTEHNYNYVNRSKTTKPSYMNTQNYPYSQNQNIPQPTSNSVSLNDQPQSPQDQSENYPFFQQNGNNTNRYHTRNQPLYYTANYSPSDDEEYYNQNHQRCYSSQRLRSYNIDQPNNFKPYTRDEQILQRRNNSASYKNSFQPQNPVNTQSYQPTQIHNKIPLPYYLQQHEKTKIQLTNFSQMPNAAESLQMTMNPYLIGGSSISSNKPLMVFTGTDPEYSVEEYLNSVTANLILNTGPERVNMPLHQSWIHRRTALIQTTLDGAAQKWCPVLPIKPDWKRFTQEFSKTFDSDRNKQHQRVLCNEICRLPNDTIKQLAVRVETLVRKAYSFNTHDYKKYKDDRNLNDDSNNSLTKNSSKKEKSHPSSIREPDLDFRKLEDKLEQWKSL